MTSPWRNKPMTVKHTLTPMDVELIIDWLNDNGLYIVEQWVAERAADNTDDDDVYASNPQIIAALCGGSEEDYR